MISAFILFPRDLDEFDLKTTDLILHLLKVLLYSFALAFIVTINLAGYDLGVAVYNYVLASAAFARSNPATKASYSASLLVVGKFRQIMHSILSSFGVRSTTPTPPACLFEDPSIWTFHCGTTSAPAFCERELGDEVSYHLPLYSSTWTVSYIESAQLDYP